MLNNQVLVNSSSSDSSSEGRHEAEVIQNGQSFTNNSEPKRRITFRSDSNIGDDELLEEPDCGASSTSVASMGTLGANENVETCQNRNSHPNSSCFETSPTSSSEVATSSKEFDSPTMINGLSSSGRTHTDALIRYSQLIQLLSCLRWFKEASIVELFFRCALFFLKSLIREFQRVDWKFIY